METKETVKLNHLILDDFKPHSEPIFLPVERFVFVGAEKHAVIKDAEEKDFILPNPIKGV